MMSDCSKRRSSDWRSERIPMVTLSKSIISAALGAWAGGSWCTVRGKWACGGCVMWLCFSPRALAAGSEEGRVGEEGRSRWAADHLKKKKNKIGMTKITKELYKTLLK